MKFKTIFLLFNLVVLFAFLFVALVPFIMLGSDFSQLFWSQNWILVLLFFLFIVLLDSYFILNWKLFIFLEKEDWAGLMSYLEDRIFTQGKLKNRYLTLYVNTCLSVSNLDKIYRLEMEIREKKPEALPVMALPLGIPYLLKKDMDKSEEYFSQVLQLQHLKDQTWLQWCLAFSLISQKKIEAAVDPLIDGLKREKKDAVLQLLLLFLLDSLRAHVPSEEQEMITQRTMELKPLVQSSAQWEKALGRSKDKNLLPTLLGSLLKDAREWILQVEA